MTTIGVATSDEVRRKAGLKDFGLLHEDAVVLVVLRDGSCGRSVRLFADEVDAVCEALKSAKWRMEMARKEQAAQEVKV
jgi:hypothetical protein